MKNMKNIFLTILLIILLQGVLVSSPVNAQINIEELTKLPDDAIALYTEAEQHYQAGFASLDRSEYLKAANLLEQLIAEYGTSPDVQDTYFALAEIYSIRLQEEVYAQKAIDTLQKFIQTFPYLDKCLDAQLTCALIQFRYLNQPEQAVESLQTYFEMLPGYNYLESEKLQGQLLLANCYRSMGNYGREQKVWDGLVISNPSADRYGRTRFLAGIKDWKRVPGEGFNLFFHVDVPERKYTRIFNDCQDFLTSLERDYKVSLPGDIEIFLYPSVDELLVYTSLDTPVAVDSDRTIHIAVEQEDQLQYLMAYLFGSAMDERSRSERHPLLRGGFEMMYFKDVRGYDIDHLAARYLLLFDESPGAMLFLNDSLFYGSAEYEKMAGSFISYLTEHSDPAKLVGLYRGLTPRHTAEMIDDAFQRRYGKKLEELVGEWYKSLTPVQKEINDGRGLEVYDLSPVKVQQSTPEETVASYFEAMRKGDFDALAKVSVPELAELWRDAKDTYEEEGVLDEIQIVEYVYPWYDAEFEITRKVIITEELLIYTLGITREGVDATEENITLQKMGGKWYIKSNP